MAAEKNYFRVAELLVNAGADLNYQDVGGYTALNTAVLKSLMNYGNNLFEAVKRNDPKYFLLYFF